MDNQPHFIYLFLLLSVIITAAGAYAHANSFTKLFVFGDSYVDTGNRNFTASSWNEPYGITYPGRPAGHFSDGHVFSEYIASWMGIKSPTPYRLREIGSIEYGMNFAYGGTGIFETLVAAPNMTIQIGLFEQLLEEKLYTEDDLKSSIALVSVSGNDYNAYIARGGSLPGLPAFIVSVVKQLGLDLERIHDLGVPKVVVMGIQPLGCLPQFTKEYSYEKCNETGNLASLFHNLLLTTVVEELKLENGESEFVMLDMYDAFMSAMKKHENETGTSELKNTLRPCCAGITSEDGCGDVENGEKKYNVCIDPKMAFFWDSFHPTQAGWHAIYSVLKSSIANLFQRELWGSF
ncbi:GDSL esterase/lipase At5g03610-like isoform X1 [Vitis riparia]|uniref:GDSL esterase/lipase At5g03610-like isoform X1 n=1 Tax=Vitis riparia TaxID=96939 RepID=UPI00155AA133|nr:GDSL esterase/lipase At5g03610-like isoform X1 [Vitis riparia]